MLIKEIYRHSHIVDWHSETALGDSSARALKIRLFDMDMYSKRIEKIYVEGTQKRLELIGDLVAIRDNLQPQEFTVTYTRTMPSDVETLLPLLAGVDYISDQTKAEMVGLDWEVESERLQQSRPEITLDDIATEVADDI
jgi:hypothetical protein